MPKRARRFKRGQKARYVVYDRELAKKMYFALSPAMGLLVSPEGEGHLGTDTRTVFEVYDREVVQAARSRGFEGRWVLADDAK